MPSGAALIQNIEKFVRGKEIRILTETPATELLTNSKGDVVGVLAKGKDGNVRITAKKVILAAGGFAKSEELLRDLFLKQQVRLSLVQLPPAVLATGSLW